MLLWFQVNWSPKIRGLTANKERASNPKRIRSIVWRLSFQNSTSTWDTFVTPYPQAHQINQILKPVFIPLPVCLTDVLFLHNTCISCLHPGSRLLYVLILLLLMLSTLDLFSNFCLFSKVFGDKLCSLCLGISELWQKTSVDIGKEMWRCNHCAVV